MQNWHKGKIKLDPDREAAFYEWAWDYLPVRDESV
jgi:hypothetical protein